MIFYFSSTGNSQLLAKEIAEQTEDQYIDIVGVADNDLKMLSKDCDESLGFVFPVYAWNMPEIVESFINKITKQEIHAKYLYAVLTCGDDVGMIDKQINKVLKRGKLKLDACFSVNMPNTYVCLPGFDVDKADVRKEKLASFKIATEKIIEEIKAKKKVLHIKRGFFPYTKTYVLGMLFRLFLITDKYFHTTTDCNKCGLCTKVCPQNNVLLSQNGPTWHGRCIGCLSCYHHCPLRSIRYGNQTKTKGQYLFKKHSEEIE